MLERPDCHINYDHDNARNSRIKKYKNNILGRKCYIEFKVLSQMSPDLIKQISLKEMHAQLISKATELQCIPEEQGIPFSVLKSRYSKATKEMNKKFRHMNQNNTKCINGYSLEIQVTGEELGFCNSLYCRRGKKLHQMESLQKINPERKPQLHCNIYYQLKTTKQTPLIIFFKQIAMS